ncbi:MAG: UDP-N-acetylmuramoyl-tripeptide--D-alanyl-D-alanine ligase [Treponema sp.]|nr:UDP-N-acetylmuramoyl-tripeptide--D-alanyl-D-alanine ligase [Treponema sp.]
MKTSEAERISLMSLEELLDATGGKLVGNPEAFAFNDVQTDSRNVKENTLFVPLVGEFQNGHKYVPQAVEAGASVVLINENEYENTPEVYDALAEKGVKFILVKNTLHGLQNAAEGYVKKFPGLIKVAITGSCGKTTTKEMVVSVLKQKFNCVYTNGNFNSETGLPLSVFQIRSEHECGIFEMGMNRENEIGEIAKVLKPEYALITNIGTAHIGILGSRENIAKEKRKVYEYISEKGFAFIPANDHFRDFAVEGVKGTVVPFGYDVPAEKSGASFVKENGLFGTVFTLDGVEINLPVSGMYNYQNALGAVALAKSLGLNAEQIKKGLESFQNIGGRMEVVKSVLKNGKQVVLVKDFYNANPDSMTKAVELCAGQEGKKIFVLGDMKELGDESLEAHRKIINLIVEKKIPAVALVGPDFKAAAEKESSGIRYFDSVESEGLADYVLEQAEENSVILLKGSNSMKLSAMPGKIEKGENL